MNNLLSYCGLVDAKIRASDKDLPVHTASPSYAKWGQSNCEVHREIVPNLKNLFSREKAFKNK